jgi:ribosomal-protein-alanine N-acetyltransferase
MLNEADAEPLLAFEQKNRAFFAQWITDRGDNYFFSFAARHQALVDENRRDLPAIFTVIPMNRSLGESTSPTFYTELGYRMQQGARAFGLRAHG